MVFSRAEEGNHSDTCFLPQLGFLAGEAVGRREMEEPPLPSGAVLPQPSP